MVPGCANTTSTSSLVVPSLPFGEVVSADDSAGSAGRTTVNTVAAFSPRFVQATVIVTLRPFSDVCNVVGGVIVASAIGSSLDGRVLATAAIIAPTRNAKPMR